MEHPDFLNAWANLIKAAWYSIVEDKESGDVFWQSPEGERAHIIRKWFPKAQISHWPIILGTANDRYVRMVEEVQAHNDALTEKKSQEHVEATKKHLHKWIEKIKSQWLLQ